MPCGRDTEGRKVEVMLGGRVSKMDFEAVGSEPCVGMMNETCI